MQEDAHDYSTEDEDSGCCLNCLDAEYGCLCFQCKCKECYWYTPPEDWGGEKGKCDKVSYLKNKKFEEWINKYKKNKPKRKQKNLLDFEKKC